MNESGATRMPPSTGPCTCALRKDEQLSFAKAAGGEVAQERAQLS